MAKETAKKDKSIWDKFLNALLYLAVVVGILVLIGTAIALSFFRENIDLGAALLLLVFGIALVLAPKYRYAKEISITGLFRFTFYEEYKMEPEYKRRLLEQYKKTIKKKKRHTRKK